MGDPYTSAPFERWLLLERDLVPGAPVVVPAAVQWGVAAHKKLAHVPQLAAPVVPVLDYLAGAAPRAGAAVALDL